MTKTDENREFLIDLLASRSLFGLEENEHTTLGRLLVQYPEVDPECMDRTAALVMPGNLDDEIPDLPSDVAAKIRASMPKGTGDVRPANRNETVAVDESQSTGHVELRRDKANAWSRVLAVGGWVAAAALLLLLLFPSYFGNSSREPTMAELRMELFAQHPDTFERDWAATEDESAKEASGSVVWSNEAQQGFMTFRGLQPNDANVQQYQLWIFDDEQEHPIDGGVFDVPPGEAEITIPIAAKLRVSKPTVFAVTVEKPGGVVVSKKERIALLAPPSSG